MIKTLTTAAALSLAVVGSQAGAVTLTGDIAPGGTYNLSEAPFIFGAQFDIGDAAGSFVFNFVNDFANSVALTFVEGTVLQSTAQFAGGASLTLEDGGPPVSTFVAEDVSTAWALTKTIAVGATGTLTVDFGDVIDDSRGDGRGNADIDFTVDVTPAPIPVPAAGLLLAGALGGLGFLRRRKTA